VDYLDYVFNYHYNYTTRAYERRIGLDHVQGPWKWFKIMGFLMAYTLMFDHFVKKFMMRRPSIISSIFGGTQMVLHTSGLLVMVMVLTIVQGLLIVFMLVADVASRYRGWIFLAVGYGLVDPGEAKGTTTTSTTSTSTASDGELEKLVDWSIYVSAFFIAVGAHTVVVKCWTLTMAGWLWLRGRGRGRAEPELEQAPRAEGPRQALDRELADLRARGLGDMGAQGADPGDLPDGQRWQGWNIMMDQAVQANRPIEGIRVEVRERPQPVNGFVGVTNSNLSMARNLRRPLEKTLHTSSTCTHLDDAVFQIHVTGFCRTCINNSR